MIALYFAFDILITVIHKWVLLRCIVTSLCREKRGSYANWLPYTVSILITLLSTWVIRLPDFHLLIVLFGDVLAVKLCYKDSIYHVLICSFLPYAVSFIIEPAVLLIIGAVIGGPFVTVESQQFGYWLVYLIDAAAMLIAAYIIRPALKDFQYQIALKDFMIILVCFFPTLVLSQSNLVPFLELSPESVKPFEWILGAGLGVVFTLVLLYVKNQSYLRNKVAEYETEIQQLERQYAYYQNKQADEEKIRALYHDMKNHLLLLKEQENAPTAETLLTQISDYENYQQTGNDFLNVVIRDKAQKAQEYQADFKCTVRFEDGGFIQPLDISTIFGNALDNAIEAVAKLPPEERMITVKSDRVQDSLVIVFENTFSGKLVQKSSKADRFLHGFGIPNIKKAVEKYDGACTIHSDGGKFIMKIMIPIPCADF